MEGCTEDGSNVLADEIIVENLYDLSVMADDGSGKLVLQVTMNLGFWSLGFLGDDMVMIWMFVT